MKHGAAFPEARVVIELRYLVEAELLVVVRADPLRGVDRALLQRRIDVRATELLRHDAELRHDEARHAADTHLDALQVVDRLDLLPEPAAHLAAGIAGENRLDAVVLEQRLERLLAPAVIPPGVRLPRVRPEAHGAGERE